MGFILTDKREGVNGRNQLSALLFPLYSYLIVGAGLAPAHQWGTRERCPYKRDLPHLGEFVLDAGTSFEVVSLLE